ncbi:MAG: hypothetical protein BWY88_00172 [Synergistetes bacterium ADurb.Bin520]|nr:MAG: hypothetical protein BWY88_00172 [Synergistetes bacterium ADurb.Bin520]
MVAPVHQGHLDADDRVPPQHAVVDGSREPLLDGGNVLPGYHTSHDAVLEDEALPLREWFGLEPDVAILPPTSGLFDEAPFGPAGFAYGLSVGHLGLTHLDIDTELPLEAIDDDLQVELSHARYDRLPRLFVGVNPEGGIFL